MQMGQLHYLPLTPSFFSILVGVFLILFFLLILGALRRAYLNLGVSSTTAMLLLLASLVGSYFNIPIAELSQERVLSDQVIDFFGMQYTVPVVEHWPGTVIAVNVGGAVIPTLMSLYLLVARQMWLKGLIAIAIVAIVAIGVNRLSAPGLNTSRCDALPRPGALGEASGTAPPARASSSSRGTMPFSTHSVSRLVSERS